MSADPDHGMDLDTRIFGDRVTRRRLEFILRTAALLNKPTQDWLMRRLAEDECRSTPVAYSWLRWGQWK